MPEAFTISIPQGNPRFKCNSGRELTKGSGQASSPRIKCSKRQLSTMTAAKVRLAMAAMGQKETKVTDLCSELAITRQTLYRHVAPDGTLRKDGLKIIEGAKIRYGKKK